MKPTIRKNWKMVGRVKNTIVAALTSDQVANLTGLTPRQLAYWDKEGFFRPQHAVDDRRSPYARIYSFQDVVGLRTISVLRREYNVSMFHLKKTAEKLSKYTSKPWSEIRLAVWNKEVIWIDPDTGKPAGVVSGQYVLFKMIEVIDDMKRATEELRHRKGAEFGKIIKHRYVAHNREVFAGTRIPVETVLRYSRAGYSADEILLEYPTLSKKDVLAALKSNLARKA